MKTNKRAHGSFSCMATLASNNKRDCMPTTSIVGPLVITLKDVKPLTLFTSYRKAKLFIDTKPEDISQEEVDFLRQQLKNQSTSALIIRFNALASIKGNTKTQKAEFILIKSILNARP